MTQLATDPAHAVTEAASRTRGQRRPRHARRWPLVALLVVVAAVVVFIATRGKAHSYVLGSVRHGTVSETVGLSGALQPTRSWSLYFRTAGTVATVDVSAGEHVNTGQVLARLNAGPLQLQVSSAQAAVTAAEAKLSADQAKQSADQAKLDSDQAKRAAGRVKTSAQSTADAALITADQSALTADQSALTADQDAQNAAEQQLTTAAANLAAATLHAPAPATVAQVDIAAGENIGSSGGSGGGTQAGSSGASGSNQSSSSGSTASGTSVGSSAAITLANGSLQALGQVSDSQIAQVHVGQYALVTAAGQTRAIHGRVEAITPTAASTGGVTTYPVEIDWSGRRKGVLDGMSAQISIVVTKTSGLTVPSSAVHTSGTHSWVLVIQGARIRNGRGHGGQATRQTINVGPAGGGLTIVRSGLHAGEQVVLADNSTPLPASPSGSQKGSAKGQVSKLLG